MSMKKKMDALTKAKLIYSIELAVFAVVFLVIGILRITGVFKPNATRSTIFNWITIFGGTWIIVDFVWAMVDKKRQKRIAMIDKIIHLPAGLYLVSFDIYCFATHPAAESPVYQFGVPAVLFYLCLCYAFEALYHFYYPVPGLLDTVEEVEVEDNKEPSLEETQEEQPKEENNDEEK